MGRRSSVYSLTQELRDEMLAKWRSGQYSLDQLAQLADGKISRSALHRYLHSSDDIYQELRMLQDAAAIWCAKLGEDSPGDIGRLCEQMLRVIAHAQIRRLHTEDAGQVGPDEVARLARALRDLEAAASMSTAREIKLREYLAAKLDRKLEEARGRGIDVAVLERAKELVRGALE
jgi:AcrR family transcriptional regulator